MDKMYNKLMDNKSNMEELAKTIECTIVIEKDYFGDSEVFLLNNQGLIVYSAYQVPIMIGFINGIDFALIHGKGKKITNINDFKVTSL